MTPAIATYLMLFSQGSKWEQEDFLAVGSVFSASCRGFPQDHGFRAFHGLQVHARKSDAFMDESRGEPQG